MKNQREIYEALLAGETLVNIDTQKRLCLVDNKLADYGNDSWETEGFRECMDWHIYKEPKWYESIPEGGVICRGSFGYVFVVLAYNKGSRFPFKGRKSSELKATPFTKAEIQTFMNNAPQ